MAKNSCLNWFSSFLNYSLDLKKVATYIAGGEDAEDDDDDDAEADDEAEDGMDFFPCFSFRKENLI